ncbi:MAG: PEGA domain-containing protein [Leptospiraceae bacterium]|nr:PEGA domain-containing protein [Leptospiraceae bacterium]
MKPNSLIPNKKFFARFGGVVWPGLVLMACSSVVRIANPIQLDSSVPPLSFQQAASQAEAVRDYKLRQQASGQIRLGVIFSPDQRLPAGLQNVIRLHLLRDLKGVVAETHELNGDVLTKAAHTDLELYKQFEQWQLDGLLQVNYQFAEDSIQGLRGLQLKLYDPVFGNALSELNSPAALKTVAHQPEHQADLLYVKGAYTFFVEKQAWQLQLASDLKTELAAFVRQTQKGVLRVTATAANVKLRVQSAGLKKELGMAPIESLELPEGHYTLTAARKGYAPQSESFFIRAGQRAERFFRYPDATTDATLAVLSAPPGQRVAFDNQVQGETPYYSTRLVPGQYQLELSRSAGQSWYQTIQSPLEIQAGESQTRLLLTQYKTNFGANFLADGFFGYSYNSGSLKSPSGQDLGFLARNISPAEWVGLVSRPLLVTDFAMNLDVYETEGQILSFGIFGGVDDQPSRSALMIHLEAGVYTIRQYRNGELVASQFAWQSKDKELGAHRLRLAYDPTEHEFRISIDGSTVFDAPVPELWVGNTGRIAILTRASNADGRPVAQSFAMYSGPGLGEEE